MTGQSYGAKTDFRYSICNQKCFNAPPTQLLNTFTSEVEDQGLAEILNKNNTPLIDAVPHRRSRHRTIPSAHVRLHSRGAADLNSAARIRRYHGHRAALPTGRLVSSDNPEQPCPVLVSRRSGLEGKPDAILRHTQRSSPRSSANTPAPRAGLMTRTSSKPPPIAF
jgi:hypothetical protein